MAVITQSAKHYAWDHLYKSEQEVIEQIRSGKIDGFENNGEWFVRYEAATPMPSNSTYTVFERARLVGVRIFKTLAILFLTPLILVALYMVGMVIMFEWGGPSKVIVDEERILGTTQFAGDEVWVTASIYGVHYTSSFQHCTIWCKYVPAHDSISISARPYLRRAHYIFSEDIIGKVREKHSMVKIAGDYELRFKKNDYEDEDNLDRAKAIYDRLTLDWCQARDRLAYRVYEAQAGKEVPWRLLVPRWNKVEVDIVPIDSWRSCIDALFWTSSPTR